MNKVSYPKKNRVNVVYEDVQYKAKQATWKEYTWVSIVRIMLLTTTQHRAEGQLQTDNCKK